MSIEKLFRLMWKEQCMGCGSAEDLNRYGFCRPCQDGIILLQQPAGTDDFHILKYEGPVRDAIHNFKYNRKTYYGKKFAFLASDFIRENGLEDFDVIIPVPLHWKKEFKRGFNQSAIVSITVARILKKKCLCGILVKVKNTVSQTKLSESERKKNVRGTFRVRRPRLVKEKKILLLDDVYTSGATTGEAKKTLLSAGASRVTILTLSKP